LKADPQTYRHKFKDGTLAALTLPAFTVEWSRRPTRQLIPEYLAWRDLCLEDFTARTGMKLMVVTA